MRSICSGVTVDLAGIARYPSSVASLFEVFRSRVRTNARSMSTPTVPLIAPVNNPAAVASMTFILFHLLSL